MKSRWATHARLLIENMINKDKCYVIERKTVGQLDHLRRIFTRVTQSDEKTRLSRSICN